MDSPFSATSVSLIVGNSPLCEEKELSFSLSGEEDSIKNILFLGTLSGRAFVIPNAPDGATGGGFSEELATAAFATEMGGEEEEEEEEEGSPKSSALLAKLTLDLFGLVTAAIETDDGAKPLTIDVDEEMRSLYDILLPFDPTSSGSLSSSVSESFEI